MTLVNTRLATAMTGVTGRGLSPGLQSKTIRAGKTG